MSLIELTSNLSTFNALPEISYPPVSRFPCTPEVVQTPKLNGHDRTFMSDECFSLRSAVDCGEISLHAYGRGQYPGTRLKSGSLPGLRSIGLWDGVGEQHWGLPMHRNEGIEVSCVLSGQMHFKSDSGQRDLRAGDITITRPWQRHCLGSPNVGACKFFWFIIDVESLEATASWKFPDWIGPDEESRRALLGAYLKNQCHHLVDQGGHLKNLIERSFKANQNLGELTAAHLSAMINSVLLNVADRLSDAIVESDVDPQGYNQTISQFFNGLAANAEKAAEQWTVDSMAHVCCVGKSYLTTSCRDIFNTTPSEQVNLIRLQHARVLLKSDLGRSITEIAFHVGFNSSQYFANCFKKQFGCTPGIYRKR